MAHSKISHQMIDAPLLGYNHLINGNFNIWQRGGPQTGSGYGSDDRWRNDNVGTTKVHNILALGAGSVFADRTNSKYYSRTVVTSVTGANNYCIKSQRIEGVHKLAGKTVLLSFYAKANAVKSLGIELAQMFGSGGSPSAVVTSIGSQKLSIDTTLRKYTVEIAIPSISGKILGTNGNDYLDVIFWFDAGTTYNIRSGGVGHQSGTFDIACVSLIEGNKDITPIPRSNGEDMLLCQRYYQYVRNFLWEGQIWLRFGYTFPVPMRTTPFVSQYSLIAGEQQRTPIIITDSRSIIVYNQGDYTPNDTTFWAYLDAEL